MRDAIAVLNAGSSSIKFSLFAQDGGKLGLALDGQVEGIRTAPRFAVKNAGGQTVSTHAWAQGRCSATMARSSTSSPSCVAIHRACS